VVVVHGLGGHAIQTWQGPNGTNWVTDREFLPTALPTSRIFTFGYNANVFKDVVSSRVVDHADGLLGGLLPYRHDCEVGTETMSISNMVLTLLLTRIGHSFSLLIRLVE
jgi:hypothetical protein